MQKGLPHGLGDLSELRTTLPSGWADHFELPKGLPNGWAGLFASRKEVPNDAHALFGRRTEDPRFQVSLPLNLLSGAGMLCQDFAVLFLSTRLMKAHRKPRKNTSPNHWRCHLTFPGRLLAGIEERIDELERGSFSNYAVELVCYDLRKRREHSITGPVAGESIEIQDAIDREILRQYRPGLRQTGEFISAMLAGNDVDGVERDSSRGLVVREARWVLFPTPHRPYIDLRCQELGFKGVSDYVTSLIRYDLLIGGKHLLFRGGDCTPEMIESLNIETIREFLKNENSKTKADYLAEEAAGRTLSPEERNAALGAVAERLREQAMSRKQAHISPR